MKHTAFKFAEEVDRLISTLSTKNYLQRIGRAKILREELYPLSRLALSLKLPGLNVEVEAFEDSGRADGFIQITGFREQGFEVQITCAGYERADALRSELLVTQGYAPGAGLIRREKRNGPITAEFEAVDSNGYIIRIASAIKSAYQKKSLKPYGQDTVLLIAFEDVNLSGRFAWDSLFDAIHDLGGLSGSQFSTVYLFNGATNQILQVT